MPTEILIIRLSALGDVVHTLPLAAAIKRHIPEARITWMVQKMAAPLLYNNPAVDHVLIFPGKAVLPGLMATPPVVNPVKQLTDFWAEFKSKNYDIAIDAQGLFKSAFLAWLSGAKIRLGFANTREWADKFLTHPVDVGEYFFTDRHIVDLNLKLVLKLLEFPLDNLQEHKVAGQKNAYNNIDVEFSLPLIPEESRQKVRDWLAFFDGQEKSAQHNAVQQETVRGAGQSSPIQSRTKAQGIFTILLPGTTWVTKIWPMHKWQELGQMLIDRDHHKVIICGDSSEIILNKQLQQSLASTNNKAVLDLTGKTNLLELIALMENVQLVIGGDTGPLHLASAVGIPEVVGIFGSTPWRRNRPYGTRGHAISLNLDCQPCYAKKCPLHTLACLIDLSVEQVYEQIKSIGAA